MTTSTERAEELLRAVLADLATVLGGITDDQAHRPTPCTEFDVARLRHHVLGWLTNFAAGYADPNGQARADIDDYRTPADPATEVRDAAELLGTSVRSGAADRPLRLGESAMPGDMALDMILWEYLVHGWDLARATGQPWVPPVEAAERSLGFAPAMLTPDYQGEGKPIGPSVPVPADAPAIDRLVGLSGRDPSWTPPG
jgi:uncharacterized protein (TIGR03086 family)